MVRVRTLWARWKAHLAFPSPPARRPTLPAAPVAPALPSDVIHATPPSAGRFRVLRSWNGVTYQAYRGDDPEAAVRAWEHYQETRPLGRCVFLDRNEPRGLLDHPLDDPPPT